MYVSNMDWTPAVDSMDDLKCQERVISFSMSTLKLLQLTRTSFFLFFLIGGTQSWNLTSLTNQNLVGFFNSSGVFWYQAVIWYDFLATKKPSRQKHLGPLCLGLRQRHPKCFGADAGQMVSPQRWLFVVTLWPWDLGRIPPWSNVTWRVLRNDVYIYI